MPVLHIQYPEWPDHGVPEDTLAVREILKRMYHVPPELGPTIVHCRFFRITQLKLNFKIASCYVLQYLIVMFSFSVQALEELAHIVQFIIQFKGYLLVTCRL